MEQAVFAWHEFNECTVRHDRRNLSFVDFADFRNGNDTFDSADSGIDCRFIRSGDFDFTHSVFFFNSNNSTCLFLNTLDNLTTRANYCTDKFFADCHCFDSRSVRLQNRTNFRLGFHDLAQDVHAAFFCLCQCVFKNFV